MILTKKSYTSEVPVQRKKNKKLIVYIEGKYAIFMKSKTDSKFEVLTLVTMKINTF